MKPKYELNLDIIVYVSLALPANADRVSPSLSANDIVFCIVSLLLQFCSFSFCLNDVDVIWSLHKLVLISYELQLP